MPPCEEMIVVTNIVKERGRRRMEKPLDAIKYEMTSYLDIDIIQGSEMYQEIDNVRDFGAESCWSGIGGFVGIFLGYSLLQIPKMMVIYFKEMKRFIRSHLQ